MKTKNLLFTFVILLVTSVALVGCKNPLEKGGGTSSGGGGAGAPSSPNSGTTPPENNTVTNSWPVYNSTVYTTPLSPRDVLLADLNLDGRNDIVTANEWDASLAVFLQDSNGNIGARTSYSLGNAEYPAKMVAADFNGDGSTDIAVTLVFSSRIKIMISNPVTGALSLSKTIEGINSLVAIRAADLNGDGRQDIVASVDNSAVLKILIQQVDGSFAPSSVVLNSYAYGLAIEDFNGDGKKDIITTETLLNILNFHAGNGNGTFQAKVAINAGANISGPNEVATGDLNGDGKLDLVVTNINGFDIVSMLGVGNGTFINPTPYSIMAGQERIVLADYNGDGKLDITATNSANSMLITLDGKGDGTFNTEYKSHFAIYSPESIAVGKINSDAINDIVVANYYGDAITVLTGKATGFASAKSVEIGSTTFKVITDDFDKDSNMDFAINDILLNQVWVYFGDGTGNFPRHIEFGGGIYGLPYGLVSGDFDKDGYKDIVVADYYGGAFISINNKDGTFQAPVWYFAGTNPIDIVTGDFDKDGNLDFATLDNTVGSPVQVQYGKGDGSFEVGFSLYTSDFATSLISSDFNGDGFADFVVGCSNSGNLHVIKSTGSRTHAAKVDYPFDGVISLVVLDFDRDGIKDFLAGRNTDPASIGFFKGNGAGGFTSSVSNYEITSYIPFAMTAADMNNDGFEDLITANQNSSHMGIYTDIKSKSLSSRYNFSTMVYTNSIAVADFNKDGKKDLVTSTDGELRFAIQLAQ